MKRHFSMCGITCFDYVLYMHATSGQCIRIFVSFRNLLVYYFPFLFFFFVLFHWVWFGRLLLVTVVIWLFIVVAVDFCEAAAIKSGTLIDNKRLFSFCQLFVYLWCGGLFSRAMPSIWFFFFFFLSSLSLFFFLFTSFIFQLFSWYLCSTSVSALLYFSSFYPVICVYRNADEIKKKKKKNTRPYAYAHTIYRTMQTNKVYVCILHMTIDNILKYKWIWSGWIMRPNIDIYIIN